MAPAYHRLVHRVRRTIAARLGLVVLAVALAGCGLTGTVSGKPPVPAGPLGPVVPGQDGGPPVECRGVPIEPCQGFGNVSEPNVVRVIVTCLTTCTLANGDIRIDVLRPNGMTESKGEGGYAGAAAAPPPEMTAPPIGTP